MLDSGGSRGGARPLPLFWFKKVNAEGRKQQQQQQQLFIGLQQLQFEKCLPTIS